MYKKYTIHDIRQHFFDIAVWVDEENTCDVIYSGDPCREINKIGVGWSCSSYNLEAAAVDGCELFISHESLFHGKDWAADMDSKETPWGHRRLAAFEMSGMACMRLHDTWDNFPEYGIRDSWRQFLGLDELVAECSYHYPGTDRFAAKKSLVLSCVKKQSLRSFTKDLAERCSVFPSFQGATLQGNPDMEIELVATGVGCHVPGLEMLELGADVLVVTFDRALQETMRIPLLEMDANIIVVEHGVSEMPGMQNMALYLNDTFPGVKAVFYGKEPYAETIIGE